MLKDGSTARLTVPSAETLGAETRATAPDSMFEEAPVALFEIGLDGSFSKLNAAARALLRWPVETLLDIVEVSVREAIADPLRRLATGHIEFWTGVYPCDPDAFVFDRLHVVLTLVRTTAGAPDHLTAVVTPVGEAREEEIRLPAFLDRISTFIGLLDTDGQLLDVNEPALEIAGLGRGDVVGRPFDQTYWWSFAPAVQTRLRSDIARAAKGEDITYDTQARVAGGRFLTIEFRLAPLRDPTGRVIRLLASAVDVSRRKAKEGELAQTADQLQMAIDVGRLGLCIFDFAPRSLTLSQTFRLSWGFVGNESVSPQDLVDRIHPDDLGKVRRALRRMMIRGAEYDLVHRVVWPSGVVRRIAMRGRLLGERGDRRAVWASADITERAQAEDTRMRARQRELVVAELGHRLNNLFPVVLSIAGLLAEQHRTLPDYRLALESRLRSLWATHTLLTRGSSESATIAELVSIETRPFPVDWICAEGPSVSLSGGLAEGFAMIVHELATNAVKHGALRQSGGTVDVRWTIDPDRILDFTWEERGGPQVAPPVRTGFGSSVIGACDQPPVCGEAEVTYRPEGLLYRLRLDTDG